MAMNTLQDSPKPATAMPLVAARLVVGLVTIPPVLILSVEVGAP